MPLPRLPGACGQDRSARSGLLRAVRRERREMGPRGLMTGRGHLVRVGGDGCGPVRRTVAHRPAAAPQVTDHEERRTTMGLRTMRRATTLCVLTGALLLGAWG